MQVEEFDYFLPEELIAQTPLPDRASSRLMVVDPGVQSITHAHFHDIGNFLRPGDVLVLNDSKVLPARIYGVKAGTGAKVELLLTKQLGPFEWMALAKPAKRLKAGTKIWFPETLDGAQGEPAEGTPFAEVAEVFDEGLRHIVFHLDEPLFDFLNRVGKVPLPPYIHVPLTKRDRYQTVYAKPLGSVAAPTAGLHFTTELLDALREKGVEIRFVTLHVGLGTFRPVQVGTVEDHVMHSEHYVVDDETASAVNLAKAEGRRVIAVGTTALRTLESAFVNGKLVPGTNDTSIFIYPGYEYKAVDALITNFHLPKSTLLMLVAAFMGLAWTKSVYETAVAERYRFFSFGDAMFITRRL